MFRPYHMDQRNPKKKKNNGTLKPATPGVPRGDTRTERAAVWPLHGLRPEFAAAPPGILPLLVDGVHQIYWWMVQHLDALSGSLSSFCRSPGGSEDFLFSTIDIHRPWFATVNVTSYNWEFQV